MLKTRNMPLRDKLAFYSSKDISTGCVVWTGHTNDKGYGDIRVEGKLKRAHRLSYELAYGTIPTGFDIDHICRNRLCINPEHLEAVPPIVNYRRGAGYGGELYEARTVCKNGHVLEGSNLYARKSKPNERCCRKCMTEQQRRRRQGG